MCHATKPAEAKPRIPTNTTTATTMRMTLRAPPPAAGTGGAVTTGGVGGVTDGTAPAGAAAEPRIAAPHLLQNRVPGLRLAPQELQNAMGPPASISSCWREYIAESKSGAVREVGRERSASSPRRELALAPEPGGVIGHGQPQQQKEKE